MTTLAVTAKLGAGYIRSSDAAYATARSGGGTMFSETLSELRIGQLLYQSNYYIYESFLSFDTSPIPDDATVSSIVLSFYPYLDTSEDDFTIEARVRDWGATLETGDWVAGANLGDGPLVASWITSTVIAPGYFDFTSESAFAAAVNKSGDTRLLLSSSRHRVGDVPLRGERYTLYSSYVSDKQPKLTIEYSVLTPDLFLDGMWG